MTAQWEEALDAQLEGYLYCKGRGRRYVLGWANSYIRDGRVFGREWADGLPDRLARDIIDCEPFWIDPDIQTLWEAATESFEPEPLLEADLLTHNGFVWLTRPYVLTDIRGNDSSMRAFMWTRAYIGWRGTDDKVRYGWGVNVTAFHRVGDKDWNDRGDGYMRGGEGFVPDGKWVAYADIGVRTGDLQVDHVMPWVFGEFYRRNELSLIEANYGKHPVNVQKPVQCMLRLMQQTVVARGEGKPSRPFRRRWQREQVEPKAITVVRLRRPKSKPTEEGAEVKHIDWQARWIVHGFWRWQWYPKDGAVCTHIENGKPCAMTNGVHRQIWISDFVKGPEDKPLVVKKRVFEVVR